MPRKKIERANESYESAKPKEKRKRGRPPAASRSSQRPATVKKITESKQRRSASVRNTSNKERRNPWEESDDDGVVYSNQLVSDYDSDSDIDDSKEGILSDDSDFEFKDGNPTVFVEDFSTKVFCPWAELDAADIPQLILPGSSSDLLVDKDHLLDTLEVYEILRTYGHIIQLSPFLFEDFCSALRSSVQSKLLCEIHIALLKLLFRDDDEDQTLYSVQDTNYSFNIMVALIEPMTFAEVLRQYVESDSSFPSEILEIFNTTNYPFVDIEKRLVVIKFLCERFFTTVTFRRLANRENKIIHDEHCRDCGRQGDVLLCDGCEACYHLACTNLSEVPHGKWLCQICELHEVNGVANCLLPGECDYRFSRRTQMLGFDRHGRLYWFLARRLFVQNIQTKELHYYSSLPQIYELMDALDDGFMEEALFRSLATYLPTIADHMRVTLELTDERRKNLQEKVQREGPRAYLHVDNIHRMSGIVSDMVKQNGIKSANSGESECEEKLKDAKTTFGRQAMDSLKELLGIEDGRLAATLWSGGCSEYELLDFRYQIGSDEPGMMNLTNGSNDNFHRQLIENLQRGYRLGFSDAEYRNYVNQYSVSDFAKSPYTRAKERDRRRYLCSRFSLTDDAEFSWICAKGRDCFGSEHDVGKWIQFTLRRLLERLTDDLMHRSWRYEEKPKFQEYLQNSVTIETLKRSLLQFECNVRKPIFASVWWNSLGHTRLLRITSDERERRQKVDATKKKEERMLTSADPHDEDFVWVKYSRYKNGPPRHNIWRLRDEQYRVNGKEKFGGWLWISCTYKRVIVDLQRPRLGINYMTSKEEVLNYTITSIPDQKAYYVDKVVKYLAMRRVLNETVKQARSHPCYSSSCRIVARGDRTIVPVLSIVPGEFRPCYSPSCPRYKARAYGYHTAEVVKAYKPFRPNPYDTGAKVPLRPEDTPGEGKAFPMQTPFDYMSKKSKRRSIMVLPIKIRRKLARQGGTNAATYIPGFHKACKNNYHVWNYPAPRPLFDNCWRYLTVTARSLHALALQLRIAYACIRWSDLEPAERDDEDPRVWMHHPDCDEVRTVINHKEHPPDGYYEQYKIRVERYALQDDVQSESAAGDDDDSADYATSSVKTLRKRKRKNQKTVQEEVYVKRRRTSMDEKWIDGVELKLYEIADYWNRYFNNKRQKYEEFKARQQLQPKMPQLQQLNGHATPSAQRGLTNGSVRTNNGGGTPIGSSRLLSRPQQHPPHSYRSESFHRQLQAQAQQMSSRQPTRQSKITQQQQMMASYDYQPLRRADESNWRPTQSQTQFSSPIYRHLQPQSFYQSPLSLSQRTFGRNCAAPQPMRGTISSALPCQSDRILVIRPSSQSHAYYTEERGSAYASPMRSQQPLQPSVRQSPLPRLQPRPDPFAYSLQPQEQSQAQSPSASGTNRPYKKAFRY